MAAHLDIPLNTFYGYVNGERPCPVEVFRDTFNITKYEPILRVMEPPGYRMEPVHAPVPSSPSVEGELMSGIMQACRVCEVWRQAIEDGRVDRNERIAIITEVERLHREVQALRAMLNKEDLL